jgi:hypothetical protein
MPTKIIIRIFRNLNNLGFLFNMVSLKKPLFQNPYACFISDGAGVVLSGKPLKPLNHAL